MLVQNKEYDSALEIIDFCESTIDEVMGRNNLDYGMCEFYRGAVSYTHLDVYKRQDDGELILYAELFKHICCLTHHL